MMSCVINFLIKLSFNEYCPKIIFTSQMFAKYVLIITENIFSNIIHQIINDKSEI